MRRALPTVDSDLGAVGLGVLLVWVVAVVPGVRGTPPAIVVGLAFVLLVPGTAATALLFPKGELHRWERLLVALAASVALVVLVGMGLALVGRFTRPAVRGTHGGVTVLFALGARRRRARRGERARPTDGKPLDGRRFCP